MIEIYKLKTKAMMQIYKLKTKAGDQEFVLLKDFQELEDLVVYYQSIIDIFINGIKKLDTDLREVQVTKQGNKS